MSAKIQFDLVAIGGTFDRLHQGHKYFLHQAFRYGQKVIIGLTSDEFAKEKLSVISYQLSVKAESDKDTSGVILSERSESKGSHDGGGISRKIKIQNYQIRKNEIIKFLRLDNLEQRVEIIEIVDVYGSTLINDKIRALLVTKDSLKGAKLINIKRKELTLKPLKVIVIPLQKSQDKKIISATRIRRGEIDSFGRIFSTLPIFNKEFSHEIRQLFKSPQGKLIIGRRDKLLVSSSQLSSEIKKMTPVMIITCGDEVTRLVNQMETLVYISIFDYQVQRKQKYYSLQDLGFEEKIIQDSKILKVKNMAGIVSKALLAAVKKAVLINLDQDKQVLIKVEGEEDLAALPAILLSPLGAVVIYGQPAVGIVIVQVTQKVKQKLLKIFI